jgi:antitoxin ParD1/3/4/toxin ParE1/3/4
MKSYSLTRSAEDDTFEIWALVAEHNLPAADALEAEIYACCQRLAERPDLGHFRRDLTDKPLRFFAVRGVYLIIYNPSTEPMQVIRILHGARDVSEELH